MQVCLIFSKSACFLDHVLNCITESAELVPNFQNRRASPQVGKSISYISGIRGRFVGFTRRCDLNATFVWPLLGLVVAFLVLSGR